MLHTLLDDYNKKYANRNRNNRKRTHTLGCLKDLKRTNDELKRLLYGCTEKLDSYLIKMEMLLNIEYGQKLGKVNNQYCVFQNGYFQQMTRWWYSENRFKTYDYVRQDLQEITKYLENYYNDVLLSKDFQLLRSEKSNMLYIEAALFNDRLISFIKRLVTGIYTLKRTYKNDNEINYFSTTASVDKAKEIIDLIDFRIQCMLDYKNKYTEMFK